MSFDLFADETEPIGNKREKKHNLVKFTIEKYICHEFMVSLSNLPEKLLLVTVPKRAIDIFIEQDFTEPYLFYTSKANW